jgi:hypothetical protein
MPHASPNRPACTCPEDSQSHAHDPECPQYDSCGGWTFDPPCGGCDWCIAAQEAYYRSLEREDLRKRFMVDKPRAEHDHGAPNRRCMECVSDLEWAYVPASEIDGIAEQTNWNPPDQVIFEIPEIPAAVRAAHESGGIPDAATHGFGPDQR